MYQVRRVNIGKTPQLDEVARECGKLYSQTPVFFWRTVRQKYCGEQGFRHVVGAMAPPTSLRYYLQSGVARSQGRENVCVGN